MNESELDRAMADVVLLAEAEGDDGDRNSAGRVADALGSWQEAAEREARASEVLRDQLTAARQALPEELRSTPLPEAIEQLRAWQETDADEREKAERRAAQAERDRACVLEVVSRYEETQQMMERQAHRAGRDEGWNAATVAAARLLKANFHLRGDLAARALERGDHEPVDEHDEAYFAGGDPADAERAKAALDRDDVDGIVGP